MCLLVMHFHNQIQSEGKINLRRQRWLFTRLRVVNDCCALNLWFLAHPEVSGILIAAIGTARSFAEVAQQAGQLSGSSINEVPFPEHLQGKYQATHIV